MKGDSTGEAARGERMHSVHLGAMAAVPGLVALVVVNTELASNLITGVDINR